MPQAPGQQESPLLREARVCWTRGETCNELSSCQETLDLGPSTSRAKPSIQVSVSGMKVFSPQDCSSVPSFQGLLLFVKCAGGGPSPPQLLGQDKAGGPQIPCLGGWKEVFSPRYPPASVPIHSSFSQTPPLHLQNPCLLLVREKIEGKFCCSSPKSQD